MYLLDYLIYAELDEKTIDKLYNQINKDITYKAIKTIYFLMSNKQKGAEEIYVEMCLQDQKIYQLEEFGINKLIYLISEFENLLNLLDLSLNISKEDVFNYDRRSIMESIEVYFNRIDDKDVFEKEVLKLEEFIKESKHEDINYYNYIIDNVKSNFIKRVKNN